MVQKNNKKDLKEVAKLFFKLGSIAFGGPAAHIAMMEDEVGHKKKVDDTRTLSRPCGCYQFNSGSNSTEMTMHCGHERAGLKGLLVAGFCFIFPAVVITSIFAWLYQEYGQLPKVEPFIFGIKPAVIAIIIMAAFRLGKKAVKNTELAILGIITLVACLLGVNEIIALFGCGLLGLGIYFFKKNTGNLKSFFSAFTFSDCRPFKNRSSQNIFDFLKSWSNTLW